MPPDIIKTQQEVAREYLCTYDSYDNTRTYQAVPEGDLDTLVATIVANIGRELEARCEGERWEDPGDFGNPDDKLIREQWAGHERAIDRTLTLIRSITGISPTR